MIHKSENYLQNISHFKQKRYILRFHFAGMKPVQIRLLKRINKILKCPKAFEMDYL